VTNDQLTLQTYTIEAQKDEKPIYDVIISPRKMAATDSSSETNFMLINNEVDDFTRSYNETLNSDKMKLSVARDNRIDKIENGKLTQTNKNEAKIDDKNDKNITDDVRRKTSMTMTTTMKEKGNKKTSESRHNDEKPAGKPIDTNHITIDNLSDIPLSSYGNLPTGQTDTTKSSQPDQLNKTGNELKDFILERLPPNRLGKKSTKIKKNKIKIKKPAKKSSNGTLNTLTPYFKNPSNFIPSMPTNFFQKTSYGSIYPNYVQTQSSNMYLPGSYLPAIQNYESYSNPFGYWGNRFQYPSPMIKGVGSAFPFSYSGMTPLLGTKIEVEKRETDDKRRRTDEDKTKLLSNFFNIQQKETIP